MEGLVTLRDQAVHADVAFASQLLVPSLRVAVSDGIYVEWAAASSRWALASLP